MDITECGVWMDITEFTADSLIEEWRMKHDPSRIVAWLRWKLDDIKSKFIALFDMDPTTCEAFFAWGHNSGYANVFTPYLVSMLENDENHVLSIMRHVELTCFPEEDSGTDEGQ